MATSASANSSASPSTSNDYPIQDSNGASEPTIDHNNQSQSQQQQSSTNSKPSQAPNTEQKRPMNAFLLFCKRQRSLVREKYPNLENRGITKILGDWWSKLDKEQKSKYTDLARQHKEAFMKANPDFKWCKTPMSNSNNTSNLNSNSNSSDCYASNNRHANEQPSPQAQPVDIVQSNSRDSLTNRHQQQQHEAPKPPKKRFLERNDSVYTKNNSIVNQNGESASLNKGGVVPYISLRDTLNRVIDEAFSDSPKSTDSPSGLNMCKCSNRPTNNLIPLSLSINPIPFPSSTATATSLTATATATTTTISSSSYSSNADEPVDFSMNRTINTTRQQIINNLVEKMLSGPTDNANSISKTNGLDSSQLGAPVRRENLDDL